MTSAFNTWIKGRPLLRIVLLLLACIPLYSVVSEWVRRLAYEWGGPWTWDTPIYWAVGRAMMNGYTNYRDIMDIKPPGIHLLSAFSYWLTGDSWVTNLAQVIALVTIVAASIACTYVALPKSATGGKKISWLLLGAGFGLLLSLYTAKRSGEVQVESFGAAIGVLYVLALLWKPQGRLVIVRFLALSLALLGTCGFKEPFLFTSLAVACVFLDSGRKWLWDFIAPLLTAMLLGVLGLAIMGSLSAYVEGYLQFMLTHHVNRFGSPWLRGLRLFDFVKDANQFTLGVGYLFAVLAVFLVWRNIRQGIARAHLVSALLRVVRIGLAIYLPFFAVGMGGEFFNHHHVFAVPAIFAWFIWLVRTLSPEDMLHKSIWLPLVLALTVMSALLIHPQDYAKELQDLKGWEAAATEEAQYVDAVLDRVHGSRYVFIGLNGPQLYGWTKHSPMGPLFIQIPEWMKVPGWGDAYMDSLHTAQLVVEENINQLGESAPEVREYLDREFTLQPWGSVADIERKHPRHRIYFRRDAHP